MLKCVDLFAGAGGFSLGAIQAGLVVTMAIEADAHAAATYKRNFCVGDQGPDLRLGDIRDINPVVLALELAAKSHSCDILLGGPPCQGFSIHRLKGSGVDDERNQLVHTYFSYVRALSPSLFLMENVPGMLWPRHAAVLERLYAEGSEAGYHVFPPVVLDARDFGVPQRRKRVFILGVRNTLDRQLLAWPPAPIHGDTRARVQRPDLLPWADCRSAFRATRRRDPNAVHMTHNQDLVSAFRLTPANGGSRSASGRTLACHLEHDGHSDVYGRIDPRQPAPTMTTACINPSKGRFVHPTRHHGITVRQAARIQTFPDTFVFEGGLMAAGQQVGNAVPVLLARKLIEHLAIFLKYESAAASPKSPHDQIAGAGLAPDAHSDARAPARVVHAACMSGVSPCDPRMAASLTISTEYPVRSDHSVILLRRSSGGR